MNQLSCNASRRLPNSLYSGSTSLTVQPTDVRRHRQPIGLPKLQMFIAHSGEQSTFARPHLLCFDDSTAPYRGPRFQGRYPGPNPFLPAVGFHFLTSFFSKDESLPSSFRNVSDDVATEKTRCVSPTLAVEEFSSEPDFFSWIELWQGPSIGNNLCYRGDTLCPACRRLGRGSSSNN
jgi:hypothetical protein